MLGEYEYDIASEEVRDWILTEAADRTSGEDPWTSKGDLRQQFVKTDIGDVEEYKETVRALIERGEFFSWHGLLTFPDDEHLRSVLEAEANANITRKRLVRKANQTLQEADA